MCACALCVTAGGLDVGHELIRQGSAIPYWRYDGVRYRKAYNEALAADAGMRASAFIEPEAWRRGQRCTNKSKPESLAVVGAVSALFSWI